MSEARATPGLEAFASIWNGILDGTLGGPVFVNFAPATWTSEEVADIRRALAVHHALGDANDAVICSKVDERGNGGVDLHLDHRSLAHQSRLGQAGSIPFVWLSIAGLDREQTIALAVSQAAIELEKALYGADLVEKMAQDRALAVGVTRVVVETAFGAATDAVDDRLFVRPKSSGESAFGRLTKETVGVAADEIAGAGSDDLDHGFSAAAQGFSDAVQSCVAFGTSRAITWDAPATDAKEGRGDGPLPLIMDLTALDDKASVMAGLVRNLARKRQRKSAPLIVLLRIDPLYFSQSVRILTLGETHDCYLTGVPREAVTEASDVSIAPMLSELLLQWANDETSRDDVALRRRGVAVMLDAAREIAARDPSPERETLVILVLTLGWLLLDDYADVGVAEHRLLEGMFPTIVRASPGWLLSVAPGEPQQAIGQSLLRWVLTGTVTFRRVHNILMLNDIFSRNGPARLALTFAARNGDDLDDFVFATLVYLEAVACLAPVAFRGHHDRVAPWLEECKARSDPGAEAWIAMCVGIAAFGRGEYGSAKEVFSKLKHVDKSAKDDADGARRAMAARRSRGYLDLIDKAEAKLQDKQSNARQSQTAAIFTMLRRIISHP